MKHLRFFSGNAAAIFVCAILFSCGSKDKAVNEVQQETEVTPPLEQVTNASFDVSEDKSSLAEYYNLDHIKEWYPKRILPPVFDFDVDLSDKTIVELSLLRNEIFARNGYLFEDAVLRGHFNQFDWYQPIFDVPDFKLRLNQAEQDFVDKVLAREKEIAKERYVGQGDHQMISMAHVYNTMQFKTMDPQFTEALARNNFAIVPGEHHQFFHVYDYNHYEYIPNFVTTDIYLQVLHKHFSTILQKTEEEKFIPLLSTLLENLASESLHFQSQTKDELLKKAAQWSTTYLAIASHLISGTAQVTPGMESLFKSETEKIMEAHGAQSAFLNTSSYQYAQFKPRGNYTKSPALEKYFRCVKWLNSAPIFIDDDERFLSAVLIATAIKNSPENMQLFRRFNDAITLIAGEEDNLSLSNLVAVLSNKKYNDPSLFNDAAKLDALRKELIAMDVDRIKPKGEATMKPAILFTAGRYTFDAEILSRLTHVLQPEPKRAFPKGLDVFAVLGNIEAEKILLHEYKEAARWSAYPDSLRKLKEAFSGLSNPNKSIYTLTMDAVRSLDEKDKRSPLFMKTSSWDRKNLVTSLAAWAELKHDMLLYSEQPYAAQAGQGGGPPPPQHIGYVEPNIAFWQKAVDMLDNQEKLLSNLDLLTEDTKGINEELRAIGTMLLTLSKKQLANERITNEEFNYLSWLGGRIERLTFRIFDSDHLPEQEKDVALVADVYNYNGVFLEEAVGMVDEIYVVAEINGKPYLTRGAVFSYYEFTNEQPLNDDEWRERVANTKVERPIWVKDIVVDTEPLKSKPGYSF